MALKINYLKTKSKPSSNLALFSNEKYKINKLRRYLTNHEFSYISDLLKTSDLKKKFTGF